MLNEIICMPDTILLYPLPKYDFTDCVLAGGSIRDSIRGEKFKDLDIFGPSRDALVEFAERNLLPDGYKSIWESEQALTYVKAGGHSVQLVYKRVFPIDQVSPLEAYQVLLGRFPFTVNQFAWDGSRVYCTPQALADVLKPTARVNYLEKDTVFESLKRLQRLTAKGYEEAPGATAEIIRKVQELTPDEVIQYSKKPKGKRGGGAY